MAEWGMCGNVYVYNFVGLSRLNAYMGMHFLLMQQNYSLESQKYENTLINGEKKWELKQDRKRKQFNSFESIVIHCY